MDNNIDIKKEFYRHFTSEMTKGDAMLFFYDIFVEGSAYVVGGYFRDFLFKKKSRDLDVIVELKNERIIEIIKSNHLEYTINRHGGIKIKLPTLEIDIWSIENNWAFKNDLVKLNEEDKLNSIARGCFYNYDSVVINLITFNYTLKYFNEFHKKKILNILQTNPLYKNLNPSMEANILRAMYLIQEFNVRPTSNTYYYLLQKIKTISDSNIEVVERLLNVKEKYPKYKKIEKEDILFFINFLKKDFDPEGQYLLDI